VREVEGIPAAQAVGQGRDAALRETTLQNDDRQSATNIALEPISWTRNAVIVRCFSHAAINGASANLPENMNSPDSTP
jgi:hypothetical protein